MTAEIIEAARARVLVGDGAMGSQLMARGLEPGTCPDLWNQERREDVLAVLTSYREAGADTLITNTFGANRWKLEGYGLAGRLDEINRAGAEICREAAGGGAFVLGDIGATGRFMAPLGSDPREAFVEIFAQQAAALAAGGVDAIILETFTSRDEILAAIEGAKTTDLPVIASMSFDRDVAGTFHTMMGDDIPSSVSAMQDAGADVVGANCAEGPEGYIDIARELSEAAEVPVIVQPNAGAPRVVGGETLYPMTPEEMAGFVARIVGCGIAIIGGCCGTTPDHVRAVRDAVDAL